MLFVDSVSFGYQNRSLFKNISFRVGRGELLRISGANGAGKTSLLNVLAGLLVPTNGGVKYEGDISKEYLASETNGHFLTLDAMANLKFWSKLRGAHLADERCLEIFSKWQLPNVAVTGKLNVGRYSTGMKRKLGLIRLEASGANLWLIDEPILGLDQGSITLFCDALKRHLSNGGACVMVSHDVAAFQSLITKTIDLDGSN